VSSEDTAKVRYSRDSEGNKTVNQYSLLKTLGIGAFAKVKLIQNFEDKQYYAAKIFKKTALQKRRVGMKKGTAFEDVMRELQIMKRMTHKNVVQLYEVINDSSDDHIYMIIEYCEGGSILKGEPEQFVATPEVNARKLFCDAVAGVEYIHGLKIIHRDIKPENLLLAKDGTVKLSDFGVSIVMENTEDEILKKKLLEVQHF